MKGLSILIFVLGSAASAQERLHFTGNIVDDGKQIRVTPSYNGTPLLALTGSENCRCQMDAYDRDSRDPLYGPAGQKQCLASKLLPRLQVVCRVLRLGNTLKAAVAWEDDRKTAHDKLVTFGKGEQPVEENAYPFYDGIGFRVSTPDQPAPPAYVYDHWYSARVAEVDCDGIPDPFEYPKP